MYNYHSQQRDKMYTCDTWKISNKRTIHAFKTPSIVVIFKADITSIQGQANMHVCLYCFIEFDESK